ncbi:hypothetical protein F4811DRAFT_548485 [Daldinia bambusicola]|nr:hypothetical protein F4811DRAFT_548485 [Daldinia bambusicola]
MATDDVNRDDNEVIIVTLVCRPHGSLVSDIPKRQFVLSSQNPSIRIGRASKVPTKGFVASIDNAWFDSPVMSRNHAELILDLDSIPKSIIIKDIGSLHGTFHIPHDGIGKEMRLEQQRPVRLSNGDCLRFGTDIFRSKETFPPCSVEFYMIGQEHEPEDIPTTNQSPNRTFTIPDDDPDDDDDDDDDDSVIEMSMTTSHKSNIQRGLSIDLTQDEDDSGEEKNFASSSTARNHPSSDIIDLTSEPDKHSDAATRATSPTHHSTSSTGPNLQEYPTISAKLTAFSYLRQASRDKSEKLTAFFVDSDTSSEDSHHFAQSDKVSSDIHLTDSEDDSVIAGEDDASSVGENLNYNSPTDAVHDVVQSEGWEDDNNSILPYSESDDNSLSSGDEMMDTLSDSSSAAPSSSPYSSPNPPVPSALPSTDASAESSNAERLFVTPFLFTASAQQDASVAQCREPSPSDAAMFKSHPVLDRTTSISRAHALGEKSGKHAFFAARESNRANHFEWPSPPPVSAIRETLGPDADADQNPHAMEINHGPHTALPAVRIEDSQNVSTERTADTDNALDPEPHGPITILGEELPDSTWQPWSTSGERFINHPRNEELPYSYPERPQSPELDMTSAYTFQLSKMASESSSSLASKPRRVEIQDLLLQEPNGDKNDNHCEPPASLAPSAPSATSSTPLPPMEAVSEPQMKRSFDDAFGNDVDVFGSNEGHTRQENDDPKFVSLSKQTQDTAAASTESNDTAVAMTPREGDIGAQPSNVPARRDNAQPSKRRRFAQAAAYVALGGAAAFTYMVSTAPVL